jgi:hypothetical protein
MKEALRFGRHRIARAVRPENRAGPAKVRAVAPAQPLPAGCGAGRYSAPTDIHVAFGARDPRIAASMTASALAPGLFTGTASIECP